MRAFSGLLLVFLLFLAACSQISFIRLEKEHRQSLAKAEKFYVVQEDMPVGESLVSGREAMNKLIKLGNKEQEEDALVIASPAEAVEKAVLKNLAVKAADIKTLSFKGKSKPRNLELWLKENNILNGTLLDAEVASWGMDPHAQNTDHYIVFLTVQMKLLDISDGKVISQYTCYTDTSSVPVKEAPTKYALLKDDKALIKQLYKERTQACVQEIIQSAL